MDGSLLIADPVTERRIARIADSYSGSGIDPEDFGLMPRYFVLTSLPHSRQKQNTFVRVNGNVTVTMATTSSLGLPYGVYPRKLLIWLTTEAFLRESPVICLGSSISNYFRSLGMRPTGGKNGNLEPFKNQAKRLFGTCISVEEKGNRSYRIQNVMPVEDAHVWWEPQHLSQEEVWEARIVLSDKFFKQIMESSVPLDWSMINLLSRSPFAIDVYIWASYRRHKASRDSLIPWQSLQAQFGAGYQMTCRGTWIFKGKLLAALAEVAKLDPEVTRCFVPQERGLLVRPGRPHVPIRQTAWG